MCVADPPAPSAGFNHRAFRQKNFRFCHRRRLTVPAGWAVPDIEGDSTALSIGHRKTARRSADVGKRFKPSPGKDTMTKLATIVAGALVSTVLCGSVSAQEAPAGRVYVFHSKAQASCPALDWHVVAAGDGSLSGMIAWDDMKAIARVSGTVNASAKTFQMTAKEVGGQGRTATVTGNLRSDGWMVANIKGPNVNCQGINVPWFVPSPTGGG